MLKERNINLIHTSPDNKENRSKLNFNQAIDFFFAINELSTKYSYTELFDYYLNNKWQDLDNLDISQQETINNLKSHKLAVEYLLEKIGEDSNNFNYLKNLVENNKIPSGALLYIDLSAYKNDIPPEGLKFLVEPIRRSSSGLANYLYCVCEACLQTKHPQAGKFVSQLLINWDEKIEKFYHPNKTKEKDKSFSGERKKMIYQKIYNREKLFSSFASIYSDQGQYFLGSVEKESLIKGLKEFKDENIIGFS